MPREIRHMCLDIQGALNFHGKKSMRGLITEDNGAQWTDKMVRDYLKECLVKGYKVLPFSKGCEGFDYQKGCPGHPVIVHKCFHCNYEMNEEEYESAIDCGCPSCRHKVNS